MRHPDVPEMLRGTFSGLCEPKVVDYLQSLGVTSVELLPIHTFINDSYLLDQGLTNYWGYNSIGFFAADPRYFATGSIIELKSMVQRLPCSRPGGDPRRRLQPHRRRQRAGPDALVPRHRQRVLLPPAAGQQALLHQRHRHRQHAEPDASADPEAGHRQPALLGQLHRRQRLPLRPRHHPRARAARLRRRLRLPRLLPAGSGAVLGQADRRAVGLRPRRLPGRRLPAGLGRMERPLPRHRALVLEGRRGHAPAISRGG